MNEWLTKFYNREEILPLLGQNTDQKLNVEAIFLDEK